MTATRQPAVGDRVRWQGGEVLRVAKLFVVEVERAAGGQGEYLAAKLETLRGGFPRVPAFPVERLAPAEDSPPDGARWLALPVTGHAFGGTT